MRSLEADFRAGLRPFGVEQRRYWANPYVE